MVNDDGNIASFTAFLPVPQELPHVIHLPISPEQVFLAAVVEEWWQEYKLRLPESMCLEGARWDDGGNCSRRNEC